MSPIPFRFLAIVLLVLGGFMFASCSKPAGNEKPIAATAIFSYYDALRSIGGDDIHSVIVLPPGASPHEYEPTLKDKVTLDKAKLIVANGLNIDPWVLKMADDNSSATLINVADLVKSQGIAPLHTQEVSVTDAKDKKAEANAEDESAGNPHIWLDPRVQGMAAAAIRDALIKIDPAHAEGYNRRAKTYLDQLANLDKQFTTATAGFRQREFVGFHSAYAYLAHRYGLTQVASVEEIPGEGPTISQTVNIIKLIKDKNIKVVFTENAFPAKATDMIVRETGVTTGVLQPLETYDDPHQTYVELMTQNLDSLKKALN